MYLSHLNALRAFEAAIRHGSFRAAAKELSVTPAAVGQQVRRLEEVVGCELLVRAPNGFAPTELALRASRRLSVGFEHVRSAMDILQDRRSALRLAITIVPTMAEHWLTPRLPDFLSQHPGIDLRIDSTHTEHFEPSPDFDFAIRYVSAFANATEEIDLFREWLVPVCRPKLADKLEFEHSSNAFAEVPLLHVESETDDQSWENWDGWGSRFGIAVPDEKHRLKFKHTTLALRSVFAGHGILLAQLSIAAPSLASGELVAPFGPEYCVKTGYPYRLSSFGGQRKPKLHLAFIEWVKSQADETNATMQAFLSR